MAVIVDGGGVDTSTLLQKTNNLSDLPDAPTARTNLGLGMAATSDTGDFDAAGSAAAAGGGDGSLAIPYTTLADWYAATSQDAASIHYA